MQVVGKIASFLLTGAACALLAACGGGSNSTASVTPPTVGNFSCPILPATQNTTGIAGIAVTCTSTGAISADGAAVTYSWVFGDQTPTGSTQPTTTSQVIHVYAQPGYYNVTLTVIDDHGTTAIRVQTIPVTLPVTGTLPSPDGVENWAWVSGSKYANFAGTYETKFTSSALNQPSARQNASSWTSPSGTLWMFGGGGYDSNATIGVLNDLWKFDPSTSQWTWIAGSSTANALGVYPSAPGPTSTAGTNVISARSAAAQWVDASGQFWLFGGSGYDKNGNSSYLNDLWMLNPQNGEATWEAGTGVGNSASVTGTIGVPNSANAPSGRAFATTWVDSKGVFWLFGGQSINSSGTTFTLNDLWSYDPNSSHTNGQQWKWVGGSPTAANVAGIYGTQNTASTSNYPGARLSAQAWTDASGNLWLFGGDGYDSAGTFGALNDLWSYNTTTGAWTWVTGSNIQGAASVYGTQKSTVPVSGVANTPSARVGTVGWVDTKGNFWLMAGSGADSTGTAATSDGGGALNELWVFNPTTKLWAWMGGVNVEGTAGVYVSPAPSTTSSIYNSPGARVWSTGWVDASGNFWMFGGTGLDSQGTSGYLNDLWTVQLTAQPTN
jgi:N-acetylneuraminic acid mutarotase